MITIGMQADLAARKFADTGNDDIGEIDWLSYYNLANPLIVSLLPSANTKSDVIALAVGAIQTLSNSVVSLVGVPMNMGADGATPGNQIKETTEVLMNRFVPGWPADDATEEIKHWMRSEDNPRQFKCWPPSDGTGKVELQAGVAPDIVPYDEDGNWKNVPLALGDPFSTATLNAMLFNAYDEDTDNPGNSGRAANYYSRLLQALGIREQREYRKKGARR